MQGDMGHQPKYFGKAKVRREIKNKQVDAKREAKDEHMYVIVKSLDLILRKRKMTRLIWYKNVSVPYRENKFDGTQRLS